MLERCAWLAVERWERAVRSSEVREYVIACRRVQEVDRRPFGPLAHGLRPQAEQGLGFVLGQGARALAVSERRILLSLSPQLRWSP